MHSKGAKGRRGGLSGSLLLLMLLLQASLCGVHADEIDERVQATMARERIPGLALLVVQSGRVVRMSTYGLANVELAVPVKHDTVFQSGSLGKQFTAVAVLLLQERGRLSLNDRISRYLPPGPRTWSSLTVRQLLDHTSGLHDSEEDGGEIFNLRHEYTDADLVRILQSYPLNYRPGSRWKYSNSGYILAGILVTRVSGMFYGDFLSREVFMPSGMRTARIISNTDIIPNRAAGYIRTSSGIRNQDFASASLNATGDGSLYLSLDDWAAWIAAMDRGALLTRESWSTLWEPVRTNDGQLTQHGFTWDHVTLSGREILEFDGSWQGFRSSMERDPSSGLTVVILANLDRAEPVPLSRSILQTVAGFE